MVMVKTTTTTPKRNSLSFYYSGTYLFAGLSRRLKCTPMLSPEDVSSIESCTHGGSWHRAAAFAALAPSSPLVRQTVLQLSDDKVAPALHAQYGPIRFRRIANGNHSSIASTPKVLK